MRDRSLPRQRGAVYPGDRPRAGPTIGTAQACPAGRPRPRARRSPLRRFRLRPTATCSARRPRSTACLSRSRRRSRSPRTCPLTAGAAAIRSYRACALSTSRAMRATSNSSSASTDWLSTCLPTADPFRWPSGAATRRACHPAPEPGSRPLLQRPRGGVSTSITQRHQRTPPPSAAGLGNAAHLVVGRPAGHQFQRPDALPGRGNGNRTAPR